MSRGHNAADNGQKHFLSRMPKLARSVANTGLVVLGGFGDIFFFW